MLLAGRALGGKSCIAPRPGGKFPACSTEWSQPTPESGTCAEIMKSVLEMCVNRYIYLNLNWTYS